MAIYIAALLQENATKSAPAVGEIMGVLSRHAQLSPAAPQQYRHAAKLQLLDLGDPEARSESPRRKRVADAGFGSALLLLDLGEPATRKRAAVVGFG